MLRGLAWNLVTEQAAIAGKQLAYMSSAHPIAMGLTTYT